MSLILTQASSPAEVMRLLTTAVPSITPCRKAVAWHPSRSGDYYERAPDGVGDTLATLTAPGQLRVAHDIVRESVTGDIGPARRLALGHASVS